MMGQKTRKVDNSKLYINSLPLPNPLNTPSSAKAIAFIGWERIINQKNELKIAVTLGSASKNEVIKG